MFDEQYIQYWRTRAISAEIKVVKLRRKLMFWRVTGVSFGIVVIVMTFLLS